MGCLAACHTYSLYIHRGCLASVLEGFDSTVYDTIHLHVVADVERNLRIIQVCHHISVFQEVRHTGDVHVTEVVEVDIRVEASCGCFDGEVVVLIGTGDLSSDISCICCRTGIWS